MTLELKTTRDGACTRITSLETIEQIAARFNRHKRLIYIWIETLAMPHVVIPGDKMHALRFNWPDVREWAKENNIKSTCDTLGRSLAGAQ